jgi:hypothetical protein
MSPRTIVTALLILAALGLAALALGPRVPADTAVRFDPASIGADPAAYLAKTEAGVPGIRPGLAKEIVWADPAAKAKTHVALVYIHGFSASKGELRPLPDKLAAALGANLFFTRLAGHGRNGAAMAEASVNDWIDDYAEAIAIGRMIGDKVVVVASSTGAALATWGATDPALARDVAAMVLISPNYRIGAFGAFLLTWPWVPRSPRRWSARSAASRHSTRCMSDIGPAAIRHGRPCRWPRSPSSPAPPRSKASASRRSSFSPMPTRSCAPM